MKQFLIKLCTFVILFAIIILLLTFAIPKDENQYLCEYNHKVELLQAIKHPRMIFIGGSNIAFGLNSKTISDSLNVNVINFGLHGGIGIKFPIEDCLDYIQNGDIAIFQFEYEDFISGGNGEKETFPLFMISTNWRNMSRLNYIQWLNIIVGMPQVATTNLSRLFKFPMRGSLDTPSNSSKFLYLKSGFNIFGDEVSHYSYPSKKIIFSGSKSEKRNVDKHFIKWLKRMMTLYEQKGARVIMLPPACSASHFQKSYNEDIKKHLQKINHPYIVEPITMVLDDRYCFDTGYHFNKEGGELNSANIIKALR